MKKNFINRILQNTRKPQGFWGRMILRSMNTGHAPLAAWAFTHLDWCPDWKVLDIGCGGGANIAHMLKRCPQGQVYGVDISPESVAFARQKNKVFWMNVVSSSKVRPRTCLLKETHSMSPRPLKPYIFGKIRTRLFAKYFAF